MSETNPVETMIDRGTLLMNRLYDEHLILDQLIDTVKVQREQLTEANDRIKSLEEDVAERDGELDDIETYLSQKRDWRRLHSVWDRASRVKELVEERDSLKDELAQAQ
jgi:DNA repair exonuclease SbcCD ATPase subunit